MASYSETVDDNISLVQNNLSPSGFDYSPIGYGVTVPDGPVIRDAYGSFIYGVVARENMHVEETYFGYAFTAGAVIEEILSVNSQLIVAGIYSPVLVDTLHLVDQLLRILPVTITETMSVADAISIARGVVLLEKIGFDDAFIFNHMLGLTLTEAMAFVDQVTDFFGRGGDDAIGFSDAFDAQFVFNRIISEDLDISSTVTANALFMRIVDEGIGYDDNLAIQAIFNSAVIDDYINFSVATLDPGGGVTTWVVNTRTQAVTEYSNYNFNSFLQIGNEYYGCNDDGLWLLNAQTDNGANIVTDIKGAMLAFGGSRFSQLDGVYLGVRTDTGARDWVLKLIVPNAGPDGVDATYYYSFRPRNMETTRVNIGKGFRYRYFQWELITAGESFDLDSIEFVPIISKRRVR